MRGLHEVLIVVGVSAFTLVGCSREPARTSVPAPSSAPPAASNAAPTEAATNTSEVGEPPAESGLAIKRGVVMLAQDRMTFRPCDEKVELWLVDQTDGTLAQSFGAETQKGPAMLYVEAYGERGPVAEDIPAARAYGGTFMLEEVLYASTEGEVHGCNAPAPDYIVAARGSEPFWAAEVGEGRMLWRQPEPPAEIDLGVPETQDSEGAARYTASAAGHQIDLTIEAQTCRDPMSGEFFAYAARAVFDGKEFSGCARVGK